MDFKKFINEFKNDSPLLVESILNGYKAIFENAEDIRIEKSLVGDDGIKLVIDGGYIDVKFKNTDFAPREQSVVDFLVNEDKRGQGIGKKLIQIAINLTTVYRY